MVRDFMDDYFELAKPGKKNECWEWPGMINKQGYGVVYRNDYFGDKRMIRVHWIAYLLVQAIPDGLVLTHTCNNKACYNPNHIKAVERYETAWESKKTHCVRGHLLPEPKMVGGRWRRVCEECRRLRQREAYKRNKDSEIEIIANAIHNLPIEK